MSIATRFAAVIVGASLLAGCTTLTEGEFNSMHATLEGSRAVKRMVIKDCIAREKATPLGEKKTYAAFMNVSVAKYETAFCSRLNNALANGRLTYADYVKLHSPAADHSKLIRIMQGR
ncbi:hypothetical protein NKH73_27670 [Mesorhizobium sp. M0938]|uniref:hypothetical protein n=1 Tax=unclassified Mesorhizobium TaxID=325217 RepID=UPI00333BEDC1